ncbi:hypothetical protein Goklo_006322 [Gossypium klotzschianum]|uniref:DUF4283 domain-containing protein n=1 Tax=Gossypium klotzschianum TaxID=34286 RepID=A0A7J8VH93_9ROSI|nr:hypothetical protein [Gossypium klotzschianum]
MASLYENRGNGENLIEDPGTSKVRFKDTDDISDVEMVIESPPVPTPSWKDIVFGKDPAKSKESSKSLSQRHVYVCDSQFVGNIWVVALQNKMYGLWRPSQPFQLMDIENGYFLAKFKNSKYYGKVLTQGP